MEWDPLADTPAEAPAAEDAKDDGETLVPITGTNASMLKKDHERLHVTVERRLQKDLPWDRQPDSKPDLSWHKPTCTLEDWKHSDVRVELGAGVAHITLNKPDNDNALTSGVAAALCDALFLLHSRQDLRVVVFSAEGKMFSAGRDAGGDPFGFSVQAQPDAIKKEVDSAIRGGVIADDKSDAGRLFQAKFWHVWSTLPQFTICIVNGPAMGDGMGPVLCSDMVISLSTATFGFTDVKLGLVNAVLMPYFLAKVSPGVAKNMVLQAQVFSAEAAYENRMIDRVVQTAAEAKKVVADMCVNITKCGPQSIQTAKELILSVAGRTVDDNVMFYTMRMEDEVQASAEAKQGREARMGSASRPWESSPLQPVA